MFLVLPPAPELTSLIKAYWFVEDLPGNYAGLIRTSPIPLAVLSVNMGRPNAVDGGGLIPNASFLGLQSRSRTWRSWSDTSFVMVMLTVAGFARLFPHSGVGTANRLLDLADLTGEASAQWLKNGVGGDQQPRAISAFLDKWLISRLVNTQPAAEVRQLVMAHSLLRSGGSVEAAAKTVQMNRRQLHRLFHRHIGIGPKELADLERMQSSLISVQSGCGEPLNGFSDQAHQIRSWRTRLGVTPGAYARAPRTPLVKHFEPNCTSSGIAFYL